MITLAECTNSLNQFKHNKTLASDDFSVEFNWFFWNAIGRNMVDSFNNAPESGNMLITKNPVLCL